VTKRGQQNGATGGGSSAYKTTMRAEVATPRTSKVTNQKLTPSIYPTLPPGATVTTQPRAGMVGPSVSDVSYVEFSSVKFFYGDRLKTFDKGCSIDFKDGYVTCDGPVKTEFMNDFKIYLDKIRKDFTPPVTINIQSDLYGTHTTEIQRKAKEFKVCCTYDGDKITLCAKHSDELRKMQEYLEFLIKTCSNRNPKGTQATQTVMTSQSGNNTGARPKVKATSTSTLKNCRIFKTAGISVLVYEGDVTMADVQCLCIATNTDPRQGGRVADAVNIAAGKKLHEEAVERLSQQKDLKVGTVCETGAGQLSGKSCVLHTFVPEWESYKPYSEVWKTLVSMSTYNFLNLSFQSTNLLVL